MHQNNDTEILVFVYDYDDDGYNNIFSFFHQ